MRRRCDSDKCALSTDKLQSILPSIFLSFIVAAQRGNNIFAILSSPCSAETIFFRFIVTAQRGNDIFVRLSSPCSAETIFLPFYRHRAAREQYFCHFIVTVQRGNDIFPFYHRRAAFLQMHLLRLWKEGRLSGQAADKRGVGADDGLGLKVEDWWKGDCDRGWHGWNKNKKSRGWCRHLLEKRYFCTTITPRGWGQSRIIGKKSGGEGAWQARWTVGVAIIRTW